MKSRKSIGSERRVPGIRKRVLDDRDRPGPPTQERRETRSPRGRVLGRKERSKSLVVVGLG